MHITAYPLYDHAVPLQPAPDARAWLDGNATLSADRALHASNRQGWELLCPYAFEATWNGGPSPNDIDIRLEAPDDALAFVQSQLGAGLLTFYPGYQFKTNGEQLLWVRGPINRPKDGISALEHLADASVVPCTVTIHWQCTRPNQTIRFAAGEPFGTMLPYPQSSLEDAILDVAELDDDGDLDIYEQALHQMLDSAAVQGVFQRLAATPVEAPPLLGIVFSRDRAMQLDATLRSFYLHCQDAGEITLYVIYKATDRRHAEQYAQLAREYAADGKVQFVEETDFRQDVLRVLAARGPDGLAEHLLFLVDDNLFVRGFRLAEIRQALADHPEALGFSLRLGANVTYHYTVGAAQAVPALTTVRGQIRRFDWTAARGYFHYPLEVSSSVFRIGELAHLLEQLPFTNPNTLEGYLAEHSATFSACRPALLCYEQAVTFCNPVNKVQTVYSNRTGTAPAYAVEQLAELFDQGYRVRVAAYAGFVPSACHQEVDLLFERCLDAAPPAQPSNHRSYAVVSPLTPRPSLPHGGEGEKRSPPCALRLTVRRRCGSVSLHTFVMARRFWGFLGCPRSRETDLFGSKQGSLGPAKIALMRMGQLLATPSLQLDQVLEQAQKVLSSSVAFQHLVTPLQPARPAPAERIVEDRQHIQRLERSVKRLTWLMVAVCLLLAGMVWQMSGIIVSVLQTNGG